LHGSDLPNNILENSLERIRKLAEDCNQLDGFIFFGSVGGNTGGGIGT
jgi:hypothetical protein